VVFNAAGPPSLFLNDSPGTNHAILLRLIGSKSNRMAVGARVRVSTAKMAQIDEVRAGGSYNSTNDSRLHFGLGAETSAAKLEVTWPSGLKQEFTNVSADFLYELTEGQALREVRDLKLRP